MTEQVEKKAYDFKVLVESLKEDGIELVEEEAKLITKKFFVWLRESAMISKTPYDDMGIMILPKLEELIIEKAEKINPND